MSSSPLRILHVDTERGWRGGQAQVAILMDALAKRGHTSSLAAPEGPLAEHAKKAGHPHVDFAPASDLALGAALSLARHARAMRPDIVHLHSGRAHATGWPAARATGAPAILTRRVLFEGKGGMPARLSPKWKLPLARVIAISTPIRDALARWGVPHERLVVVPDALEVANFERAVAEARASGRARALRTLWGAPAEAPLVGMLAAFTPEKDHDLLIEAAALAITSRPDLHVVALGDGPRLTGMRAQVARRGLAEHVLLPGRAEDVATALAALDAFALFTRAEGLGSSLLLAQAARLPVIATCVGGVPDVVEDGRSGRLVQPDDVQAAARALLEAVQGGADIERRVEEARRRVDAFDAAASAERHEALYGEVLSERGKPWERPR